MVHPTDTVWGIAARADRTESLMTIARVKRTGIKPFSVVVPTRSAAYELGVFNAHARKAAHLFWPGAFTLIVPSRGKVKAPGATVGLRVPADVLTQRLTKAAGALYSTSANLHGMPTVSSFASALAFARRAPVPIMVLDGPKGSGVASRIFKVSPTGLTRLR